MDILLELLPLDVETLAFDKRSSILRLRCLVAKKRQIELNTDAHAAYWAAMGVFSDAEGRITIDYATVIKRYENDSPMQMDYAEGRGRRSRVKSVERLSFRTGGYRDAPTLKTSTDHQPDQTRPNPDDPEPLWQYWRRLCRLSGRARRREGGRGGLRLCAARAKQRHRQNTSHG